MRSGNSRALFLLAPGIFAFVVATGAAGQTAAAPAPHGITGATLCTNSRLCCFSEVRSPVEDVDVLGEFASH